MKPYNERIDGITSNLKEEMYSLYKQGYDEGKDECSYGKLKYQQGLNDAWECAKKMELLTCGEVAEIFGEQALTYFGNSKTPEIFGLINQYPASEAIAKIKEYEEKQKVDDEIKVGDEVLETDLDLTFVITRRYEDKYEGMCSDGACYDDLNPKYLKKTGRKYKILFEEVADSDE